MKKKGNIVSTILITNLINLCIKKKEEGLSKDSFIELYKETYDGELTAPLLEEINKVYEVGTMKAYKRLNKERLNQYHVQNYFGKFRIKEAVAHKWSTSAINKKHPFKTKD